MMFTRTSYVVNSLFRTAAHRTVPIRYGCFFSSSTGLDQKRSPALILDIDGVITRGAQVIPAAKRALHRLYRNSKGNSPRLPLIFMTNGGGCPEAELANRLSKLLEIPVLLLVFLLIVITILFFFAL